MPKFASIWKTAGTGDVLKYIPPAGGLVGLAREGDKPPEQRDPVGGFLKGTGASQMGGALGGTVGVLGGLATALGAHKVMKALPAKSQAALRWAVHPQRASLGSRAAKLIRTSPAGAGLFATQVLAVPVMGALGASLGSAHLLDKHVPEYVGHSQGNVEQSKISSFVRKGGLL